MDHIPNETKLELVGIGTVIINKPTISLIGTLHSIFLNTNQKSEEL